MQAPTRPPLRPDIEGLRGIAILLVVLYHVGVPGFTGGYIGVDVFFVLSGYLITWLLVREIEGTGRLNIAGFYARRGRRLLPALGIVLFVTAVCGYFIFAPYEQVPLTKSALATSAYLSNLQFARSATNYLGAGAETNPFLHTWSLAVEEQFYFVWPLLVLFALAPKRNVDEIQVRRTRLVLIMVAVSVASFALSFWLTRTRQPWAFFSSATRAWEFGVGGLGVLLPIMTRARSNRILGWVGLLALLYSAVMFDRGTIFPGAAAILPVFGTVALLRAGAAELTAGPGKYLKATWLQWFGRLSYSWYLWHWPVLVFGAAVATRTNLPFRIGLLLLSLGLAVLSYRFVENPIRHQRTLVARPAYSLAMVASLTVLGLSTALFWRNVSVRASHSASQFRFTKARGDVPIVYANGCHLDFYDVEVSPEKCVFGNRDASITVVLLGDSHAAQWFPALDLIARNEGWRLVPLTKSACPSADVSFVDQGLGRRYTECEQWRAASIERIKRMRPDLVITANSLGKFSTNSEEGLGETQPLVSRDALLTGMRKTLNEMSNAGLRVIQLQDTPRPEFDPTICMARDVWHRSWGNVCTFDRKAALDEDMRYLVEQASVGLKNVTTVDLTDYICPWNTCEPERGSILLYRDAHHLTSSFVNSLSPVLQQILKNSLMDARNGSMASLRAKQKLRRDETQ